MRKYRRYENLKDSGVKWLGSIPQSWAILPVRAVVENINIRNEGAKDQNYLSLMANIGVVTYEDKGDVGNKKPDDLSKCKIVRKGNLVINSMNYSIGSYGMSAYDGVCSPVYIVLNPNKHVIQERYALRVFENRIFQSYLAQFGNGILAHRAAINWDDIKGAFIPVPPKEDQIAILNFLDYEISKIDRLIKKQQILIKLIKEKMESVISHCITKGIRADVTFVNSNLEWLGMIPQHWKLIKAKYLFEEMNREVRETDGIVTVFRDGQVCLRSRRREAGYTMAVLEHGYQGIRKGDLVLHSMDAFAGAIGVSEDDGRATPEYVVTTPFNQQMNCEYFADILRLMAKRNFIYVLCPSVRERAPRFRFSKFKEVLLPVPSIDEQNEIRGHLQMITNKFNQLIKNAEDQIVLLQERRTVLISETVTGKIDVREWLPPNTKENEPQDNTEVTA
jgi:type I restriction enzyme S subunit